MRPADLVLVQGLVADGGEIGRADAPSRRGRRADVWAEHGGTLGVRHLELVDGTRRRVANRLTRVVRGTARGVDAALVMELHEATLRTALADPTARAGLRELAACAPYGFDPVRSFILVGAPCQLLDGPARGQRVLWFGRGAPGLDETDFVTHYTRHHGPLVAAHAPLLGLRRYRQVPNERGDLGEALRGLGLGCGVAPAVFAELYIGPPTLHPGRLKARRAALREIRTDEERHIDFGRSMLLLG